MNSSVVLIHGKPGSGKSTSVNRAAAEIDIPMFKEVLHFSVGNHLRGILSDTVTSRYKGALEEEAESLKASRQVDNSLVTDIVGEFLGNTPGTSLTLVDGYPLYVEQLDAFWQMSTEVGATILGLVEIDIPDEVALERMSKRGTRNAERQVDHNFLQERVDEYNQVCRFTVEALAQTMPHERINGLESVNIIAENIGNVVQGFVSARSS